MEEHYISKKIYGKKSVLEIDKKIKLLERSNSMLIAY